MALNQEQRSALVGLQHALSVATASGLFDEMLLGLHPDVSKTFCDEVADFSVRHGTVDSSVFCLVQEGGSSEELYLHSWDSLQEAEQDREDCASNGAYRTGEVVEVPGSLADHPMFHGVVEALIRSVNSLE
jgi:hypothetical protein